MSSKIKRRNIIKIVGKQQRFYGEIFQNPDDSWGKYGISLFFYHVLVFFLYRGVDHLNVLTLTVISEYLSHKCRHFKKMSLNMGE
jgi:hypothetical protein